MSMLAPRKVVMTRPFRSFKTVLYLEDLLAKGKGWGFITDGISPGKDFNFTRTHIIHKLDDIKSYCILDRFW